MRRTEAFLLVLFFIVVFVSRLPFLSAGYGVDVDGWRFAAVARNISVTGQYGYSRVPGHPFQEIIASFFWRQGPSVLNGMTALMSAIAAMFFALIMKRLEFKNYLLPALAFAFTPLIYINSTNSMDYVWALAFILGSLYFAMDGLPDGKASKPIFAGVFLGLAIACRATSGFMVIPLVMILYRDSRKSIFKFVLTACIIGIIFYVPAYLRYGFDFLKDFTGPYPGAVYVLFRIFIATWGLIGFAAIVIALVIQIFGRKNQNKTPDKYFDKALLTGTGIYLLLFLAMPYKATYLIPVVPLVLILLFRFLQPGLRNFVCLSLIASSFLLGASRPELNILPDYTPYSVNLGNQVVIDFLKGPVLSDNSKRLKQLEHVNKILDVGDTVTSKSVVATGESYPLIDVTLPYNIQGKVIYEYLLDSTKLKKYTAEGYSIYYLPDEEKTNLQLYNINLINAGAKPFLTE